jgi:hypothetical protein
VQFDTGDSVFDGSELSGNGALVLIGGTLAVNQNQQIRNLTIAGGVLTGSGAVEVTQNLTWSGGSMSGSGLTRLAGGGTGAFSSRPFSWPILGRTLENAGAIEFSNPEGLSNTQFGMESGATLRNLASGLLDVAAPVLFERYGAIAVPPVMENQGVVRRRGAAIADIRSELTNSGSIEVESGELWIRDGASDGDFTIASGATLSLVGNHILSTDSTVSGAGIVRLFGGTNTIAGAYNITGTTAISAGVVHFIGSATMGAFTQTGGTLRVEIAGVAAGEFDKLNITGQASLGGALQVAFVDGFTPLAGDEFQILDFGSLVGTFAFVSVVDLPPGLSLQTEYNAINLIVRLV